MKKKKLAAFVVAVVAVIAGYNIFLTKKTVTLSDLALVNVEALANDESGSGNTVTCYSSSSSKSGSTYYDCGSCSKQFNSQGTGSSSTCNT